MPVRVCQVDSNVKFIRNWQIAIDACLGIVFTYFKLSYSRVENPSYPGAVADVSYDTARKRGDRVLVLLGQFFLLNRFSARLLEMLQSKRFERNRVAIGRWLCDRLPPLAGALLFPVRD